MTAKHDVIEQLRENFSEQTSAGARLWELRKGSKKASLRSNRTPRNVTHRMDCAALEQAYFLLCPNGVLISFFQVDGSVVTAPLINSIKKGKITLTKTTDASFLMNALLDAVVDHALPVVEFYSAEIAAIEREVLERPKTKMTKELHLIQGELLLLQKVIGPMNSMILHLSEKNRDTYGFVSDLTRIYLRDVLDHTISLKEHIETLDRFSDDLIDLIFNSVSHAQAQASQVLTIFSTVFLPLTFLAGVYGTNFHTLPELEWEYGYLAFWMVCLVIIAVLLGFFKWRGWFES